MACPGAGICFPPPPPEWNGPSIMLVGQVEGVEPVCPAGTEEIWRAGAEPAAPCDCSECGGAIGCELDVEYGSNGLCEESTDLAGCQPFSSELTGQFVMSFNLSAIPGESCTSPEPGETEFQELSVGCAPIAKPCDGGVCLLGPACISRLGDLPCPPAYPERSLLHTSVAGSELSCDSCECGDEESLFVCTEASVAVYESEDCSGDPIEAPHLYQDGEACLNFQEKMSIVLIEEIGSIDVDIPPTDCSSDLVLENALGEFIEEDPRTVCCSG